MARHDGWLRAFSRLGMPLFALWLLLCSLASCGSSGELGMEGPLVRLHLSPVDDAVMRVTLSIAAQDATGQDKQNLYMVSDSPFDLLGVSFPVGTRGTTTYQVSVYGASDCLLASGTATLNLDSDGVFDVTVMMTSSPLCGNGAKLTVQVSAVNKGMGTVTSTLAGINCTGAGAGCSVTVMKGTQITLSAQAAGGSRFAGWSGGGCSGTAGCTIDLNQDTEVQAIFSTCTGWCQEQLPFAVTANLNGIAGTSGNNIYVVGDSGTVLNWDGTTWQKLAPPAPGSSVNLRAVAIRATPGILNIAGDSGAILQLQNGTWKTISNSVITGAIRSIAIGGNASTPDTHFVGDSTSGAVLASGGTSVTGKSVGGAGTIYSIFQNPSAGNDELYLGGAVSGGKGYAAKWDGNNSLTQQMASGPNPGGDINAMLCLNSYFYAAGANGAIYRRTSNNGQDNSWASASSPVTNNLRGMWGALDSAIVAVGDGGTIVQYDGFNWTKVNGVPISTRLNGVWGTSPSNIYAVGDGGVILHYLP